MDLAYEGKMKTEFIRKVFALQKDIIIEVEKVFPKDYVKIDLQTFKEHNWDKPPREIQEIDFDIILKRKNSYVIEEYTSSIVKKYKIITDKFRLNLFINYTTKNTFHNFKQFDIINKSIYKKIKDLAINFKGKVSLD